MPEISFLNVNGVLVNKEIAETKFTCDLSKCKGGCCTLESEFGAPLKMEEISFITDALPEVLPLLPPEHRAIIEEDGFFEIKNEELLTRSVKNRSCVFVYFENGIAFCGIEKAYFQKKIFFRKPISCHLFPIRISQLGGDILRYERFSECRHALEKGKETGISISEFCKDSLIRQYGEAWYSELEGKARE